MHSFILLMYVCVISATCLTHEMFTRIIVNINLNVSNDLHKHHLSGCTCISKAAIVLACELLLEIPCDQKHMRLFTSRFECNQNLLM